MRIGDQGHVMAAPAQGPTDPNEGMDVAGTAERHEQEMDASRHGGRKSEIGSAKRLSLAPPLAAGCTARLRKSDAFADSHRGAALSRQCLIGASDPFRNSDLV